MGGRESIGKTLRILRPYITPFLLFICLQFYDKKYLRGKYFDRSWSGWSWAFRGILWQKILGFNRSVPWPVSSQIRVLNWRNIEFDVDDINNFQSFGNYYQNFNAKITIGKGSFIGPNVGIITSNHNLHDLPTHGKGDDVMIGKDCWIGMNSVLLPGVILGDGTVVGAGSVVTKPFPEGHQLVAGNPATVLKKYE